MTRQADIGPLLQEILDAQRADESALRYPALKSYAAALTALSGRLRHPVVVPVSAGAQRLVGAAVLISRGRVEVCGWSEPLTDKDVLVVTLTTVTPASLVTAAERARALGAREVHACAIGTPAFAASSLQPAITSFSVLRPLRMADDAKAIADRAGAAAD